jgi:hypothetical protein
VKAFSTLPAPQQKLHDHSAAAECTPTTERGESMITLNEEQAKKLLTDERAVS